MCSKLFDVLSIHSLSDYFVDFSQQFSKRYTGRLPLKEDEGGFSLPPRKILEG